LYKNIESLGEFLQRETIYESADLVAFNKPPQLSYLVKNKNDESAHTKYLLKFRELVKEKYKWSRAYQYLFVDNEISGISLFMPTNKKRDEIEDIALKQYTSNNITFLKYYAITAFIPLQPDGKRILYSKLNLLDHAELLVEEPNVTRKQMQKDLILTHHVEHKVIDYNQKLNVALVELNTTLNKNEGVQLCCAKNLSPCLGDHKYSHFVTSLSGRPFPVDVTQKYKRKPQDLDPNLLNALDMNSYMVGQIPLHLHLSELNFNYSFKKQYPSSNLKLNAPLWPYFNETLSRLGLKFRNDDITKKDDEEEKLLNKEN